MKLIAEIMQDGSLLHNLMFHINNFTDFSGLFVYHYCNFVLKLQFDDIWPCLNLCSPNCMFKLYLFCFLDKKYTLKDYAVLIAIIYLIAFYWMCMLRNCWNADVPFISGRRVRQTCFLNLVNNPFRTLFLSFTFAFIFISYLCAENEMWKDLSSLRPQKKMLKHILFCFMHNVFYSLSSFLFS